MPTPMPRRHAARCFACRRFDFFRRAAADGADMPCCCHYGYAVDAAAASFFTPLGCRYRHYAIIDASDYFCRLMMPADYFRRWRDMMP